MAPFTAINRRRSSKSQSPKNNNFSTGPTKQSPKSKSKSPFTLPLIENIPKARILTSEAVSQATMAPPPKKRLTLNVAPRKQATPRKQLPRASKIIPSTEEYEPLDPNFETAEQAESSEEDEIENENTVSKALRKRPATRSSSSQPLAKRARKQAAAEPQVENDEEEEIEEEEEAEETDPFVERMQAWITRMEGEMVCVRTIMADYILKRAGNNGSGLAPPALPVPQATQTTTGSSAQARPPKTDGKAPWSWTEERDVLDLTERTDYEQMSQQEREDEFATYEPNKRASQYRTWQSIRQRIKLLGKLEITKADLEREKKTHIKILRAKAEAAAAAGTTPGTAIAGPSNASSKKAGHKKSASKKSAAKKTATKKAPSKTATSGKGKQKAVEDDDEIMEDVNALEVEDDEADDAPELPRSTRSKSRSRSAEA